MTGTIEEHRATSGSGSAGAVVDVVAYAAVTLLRSRDIEAEIPEVLQRLGEAIGVSRVYLFENFLKDGELCDVERFEWVSPGVESTLDPDDEGTPYLPDYERYIRVLGTGGMIAELTRDAPPAERPWLEREDVLSSAFVPIFVGDGWWGYMGFDDCWQERAWSREDLAALRVAAETIGAALERQALDGSLAEMQDRYRSLVEAMPAVSYYEAPGKDPETGADMMVDAYVSPQARVILGLDPQRWADEPHYWEQHLHPGDRQRAVEEYEEALRSPGVRSMRYRMVSDDGRVAWVRDDYVVEHDGSGRPSLVQGVIVDVTQAHEDAQRLRETEVRYRTVVEQARDIIVYADLLDEDAKTAYVSPQIEDILGVTPERWLEADGNELWFAMVHPDDLERVQREYEVYLGGGPDMGDYRMVRDDGRVVWIRDRARVMPDPDGSQVEWGVMIDVTEEREARERLREAEVRYRTLIEQLLAVVYTEDAHGNVLYVSPGSERILGVTPERWMSEPGLWRSLLHPNDIERAIAHAEAHEDPDERYVDEYRLRGPDGAYRWIRDEAAAVFDADGNFDRWQGLMIDVTDQKHAQERVAEAEARFQTLVEQIAAVTYIEAPDGPTSTIYMSPQVERLTGYTPEEWIADPEMWQKLLHPDDRDRSVALAVDVVERLQPYLNEHRMLTRDGRVIWVHDEEHPVFGDDGEVLYWLGVMFDITEEREAQRRLRDAERRFRVLVEELPVITYIDAIADSVEPRYISPQLESMLGYTQAEWVADPRAWERVVVPEDLDHLATTLEGADRTLEPYRIDYRATAADGRIVWLHEEAHVVTDDEGVPLYWLGVVLDISHRKETEDLERALAVEKATSAKLRELDELKDQFLAGVSHDLRTPLSSILGYALTLQRDDGALPEEDRRDFLNRIAINAQKLQALVNDLLDVHRLNQGVQVLDRRRLDVGTVVGEVVEQADYLSEHEVMLEAESVVISADEIKLKRTIENLLTNTARHTPAGTRVWIRVTTDPAGALITVEDAGPGIPVGEKEGLFEEFTTGESSRAGGSPGLGVGLSLVARFAELHGGRAWAEDRPGGGAVFRVLLPDEDPGTAAGE